MTTLPNPSDSGLPPIEDVDTEGLTLAQRLDLEIILRQVEACNDKEALKKLAHSTVKAWYVGKSNLANAMLKKLTEDHQALLAEYAKGQQPEPEPEVGEDGIWRARVQNAAYETFFQPDYLG